MKHLTSLNEPILLYEKSGNRNEDNIDVGNSNSNGNSEAPNGYVGLVGKVPGLTFSETDLSNFHCTISPSKFFHFLAFETKLSFLGT